MQLFKKNPADCIKYHQYINHTNAFNILIWILEPSLDSINTIGYDDHYLQIYKYDDHYL
jgi:hypothetical protein